MAKPWKLNDWRGVGQEQQAGQAGQAGAIGQVELGGASTKRTISVTITSAPPHLLQSNAKPRQIIQNISALRAQCWIILQWQDQVVDFFLMYPVDTIGSLFGSLFCQHWIVCQHTSSSEAQIRRVISNVHFLQPFVERLIWERERPWANTARRISPAHQLQRWQIGNYDLQSSEEKVCAIPKRLRGQGKHMIQCMAA